MVTFPGIGWFCYGLRLFRLLVACRSEVVSKVDEVGAPRLDLRCGIRLACISNVSPRQSTSHQTVIEAHAVPLQKLIFPSLLRTHAVVVHDPVGAVDAWVTDTPPRVTFAAAMVPLAFGPPPEPISTTPAAPDGHTLVLAAPGVTDGGDQ